jgi:hypothetical protein
MVVERVTTRRKLRREGILDGDGKAIVDIKLFEIFLFCPVVPVNSGAHGITRLW